MMTISQSDNGESSATILVVDDQPELLDSIGITLRADGYNILKATDVTTALTLLENQPVDLILADIAMPGLNGYQFYERVRENSDWLLIPFIFLTGRGMDSDIRYGKALGADDYLVKPIEVEDLLAAVKGKLRRIKQLQSRSKTGSKPASERVSMPQVLTAGRLKIEPGQHRAWLNDELLQLSPREFKLLAYMTYRLNQVVSPQELVQITHDLETDQREAGSLLRPLIRTLRRKLGYSVGEMGCIENVRGVGYRMFAPE